MNKASRKQTSTPKVKKAISKTAKSKVVLAKNSAELSLSKPSSVKNNNVCRKTDLLKCSNKPICLQTSKANKRSEQPNASKNFDICSPKKQSSKSSVKFARDQDAKALIRKSHTTPEHAISSGKTASTDGTHHTSYIGATKTVTKATPSRRQTAYHRSRQTKATTNSKR